MNVTAGNLKALRARLIQERRLNVVPEVKIEDLIMEFPGSHHPVPVGYMIDLVDLALLALSHGVESESSRGDIPG
jgi:hypothetical protein